MTKCRQNVVNFLRICLELAEEVERDRHSRTGESGGQMYGYGCAHCIARKSRKSTEALATLRKRLKSAEEILAKKESRHVKGFIQAMKSAIQIVEQEMTKAAK